MVRPGSPIFDEQYWVEAIKNPFWYREFVALASEAGQRLEREAMSEFNFAARSFFAKKLIEDRITLAESGPDIDAQRQPIDTVVIHHTGRANYQLDYMEATHLLNIYAQAYASSSTSEERALTGGAIWSNHFSGRRQSFLCYHWLMRMDGSFERLLEDGQIGWHAGNWEVNKRSVAICLDNDYEKMCPTGEILKKLARHVKQNYPEVKPQNIIGHREARQGTICPGSHFLEEWKPKLIKYIKS